MLRAQVWRVPASEPVVVLPVERLLSWPQGPEAEPARQLVPVRLSWTPSWLKEETRPAELESPVLRPLPFDPRQVRWQG